MGIGAIAELPNAIKGVGSGKALIVTDPGLVQAGLCRRIEEVLTEAGLSYAVFSDVEPDPRLEIVEDCAQAAEDADCDLFIGLGGGSSLDIAKVAAILNTNDGSLTDYLGIGNIPKRGAPTIMIPTTAGTGSEVTPIAVLSDKKEQLKKGVVSEHLYPDVALVDPALMTSLPPHITAFTGIDALTHAIEAYTNKYAQPFVDTLALEAIRLIGENLRRAVSCGDDVDARCKMALGSLYGGLCLGSVNTAAVHALAYPLGGMFDVPHGVANSLLLPYVMKFNLVSDLDKYSRVAEALGCRIDGLSKRDAAEKSVDAVAQLSADVGIARTLQELEIPQSAIEEMATAAMKVVRLLGNNPRQVTETDARAIYTSAYC